MEETNQFSDAGFACFIVISEAIRIKTGRERIHAPETKENEND